MRQQTFRRLHPQRHMGTIKSLHIVTAFHIFNDVSPPGTTKRLNRVDFSLFHFNRLFTPTLNDRHRFAGMNLIRPNRMAVQIPNRLDGVRCPVQFDLVRFHHLLNLRTDVTQSNVDSRRANAGIRRLSDTFQQWIVPRIETRRPGAIDDPSFDLNTEIDLHDVIVLQYRLVTGVGSVMGRDVIQRTPGGESDATFQSGFLDEFPIFIFQLCAHVGEFDAGLDDRLGKVPDLSMDFGTPT
mmetsp:Transcript_92331/g.138218  ORF Transcript_92331/g.138218 Transcript_92331/m.138218 type:complete len:239 (-) Transcript_92331:297-1013(-)